MKCTDKMDPCVFPVIYKGVTYPGDKCIDADSQGWCSTKADANGNHVDGYWGYCGKDCVLVVNGWRFCCENVKK